MLSDRFASRRAAAAPAPAHTCTGCSASAGPNWTTCASDPAGDEIAKPGFTRLNFSVLLSDEKVDFILDSVARLQRTPPPIQNATTATDRALSSSRAPPDGRSRSAKTLRPEETLCRGQMSPQRACCTAQRQAECSCLICNAKPCVTGGRFSAHRRSRCNSIAIAIGCGTGTSRLSQVCRQCVRHVRCVAAPAR